MKKVSLFLVFSIALVLVATALDDAYYKAFGYGAIVASGKSYPAFAKYDPKVFEIKDKKFLVKSGPDAIFFLRGILPKGMTIGKYEATLLKAYPDEAKYTGGAYHAFRFYPSHDNDGKQVFKKWPEKPIDANTAWHDPLDEITYKMADVRDWDSFGFVWETNIGDTTEGKLADWVAKAKPGYRLYVTWTVGMSATLPGEGMESKWDINKKQFVDVPKQSLLVYRYLDPVMACTIEFK